MSGRSFLPPSPIVVNEGGFGFIQIHPHLEVVLCEVDVLPFPLLDLRSYPEQVDPNRDYAQEQPFNPEPK